MASRGANGPIELTIDQQAIQKVARALRAESDGKALRKELIAEIKTAVSPGVSAVQSKLRSIPHSSAVHQSPSLGSYLASRVRPQVRLSGRSTGVRIRIAQTPNLRGFSMAARRLNRAKWRHEVFGNPEVWVDQESPIPGFFDDTLAAGRDTYRKGVVAALESMARRIAERSRS